MFTIDSTDRIARIGLDRAPARNAIGIDQWRALTSHLHEIAASGVRALIVWSSVPGIFTAGADLGELAGLAADPALRTRFRTEMAAAFETLATLPIATIAAIDGGCYGAGVALALACDIRVAGDAAAFAITPAKVGIVYPAGDVARLRALVGAGQASRLLLSGMTIDADEASRIGLVEERVELAETAARALAETIAGNARGSVAGLKRIIAGDPASDQLFEDAFGGDDLREGLAAFRERRKPVFGV